MRREVDRLHHAADGARLHQFAGFYRGLHFQALAVQDRVRPPRFADGLANLGQLLQRGHPGLIGKDVFAMPHSADADGGAVHRNR